MILHVFNLVLIGVYSFIYYKLTAPPENWIVDVVLTVTWVCNIFAIALSISGMCICRHSTMPLLLYRELRVALMCNYILSYVLLSVICNTFLYVHNHLNTAVLSSVSILLMVSAIFVFVLTDVKTTSTGKSRKVFINRVIQSWDDGDFVKVAAYLSQCSTSEVSDITLQVSKKFGSGDAELIQELTR